MTLDWYKQGRRCVVAGYGKRLQRRTGVKLAGIDKLIRPNALRLDRAQVSRQRAMLGTFLLPRHFRQGQV